mgnify:FL=1
MVLMSELIKSNRNSRKEILSDKHFSPIFIGRQSKSGGSLLRTLIGKHDNIFGGDGFETGWFTSDISTNWKDDNTLRQKWLREWFEVDMDTFKKIKQESLSGIDFFNKFMNYCTFRAKKNRWIENSPGNIGNFDIISDFWPGYRFIHCTREYKDTFSSWKTRNDGTLKDKTAQEFVGIVKSSYKHIFDYLGTQNDQYIEVKYEDTVNNTEKVLRNVMEFLGEEWIDNLHIYNGSSNEIDKCRQVIKKDSSTSIALTKPIFKDRIGHWVNEITEEEANFIDDELGFYAEKLGY